MKSIGRQAFYGCNNALFYIDGENIKQQLIKQGIPTSRIILNVK
ncbi:hypothetical protein FHU24_003404 [Clostridium saccharobutylicum]|nr:hypothetical protein [Clostridium saccharobutylicum]MBA8791867.1 hypothetical protein [Clostridium saccharobutylicum]MBA8898551.1 hypothetical protein [Clostridium saccharobutylicum]MBA8983757.1 hypothetical protein [Clostridium saccharobutylicum]MBA8996039.1 hypothetical protein [Clostridium saccharobutylicum]